MKKIQKILIIFGIMMIFAVSCGKKGKVKENTSKPVKTQIIEQNSLSLGYTASGTLKGIEEVPYTATSTGEIVVINAKNGDYVNAGQIIVSIDNQEARSNVESAASNVNIASSNIVSAEAALEEAKINYEKYLSLYEKKLITQTEYLNAKTTYNTARANLAAMKSNLSSAKASLNTAQDASNKAVIKTSTSGTVANMNLELHQQTALGSQLFTIVNESEMKIEVGVSPEIINKIQVGSQAKVKIDELEDTEVIGTVYEVSSSADTSTRQFTVKVKIPNPERVLKSGMYGTVNIDTGAENGLIIPKKAIVVRGVEQIIYIVKEGKATAIPVKISNQNEENAAVTGKDLMSGMELVVDGQNLIQTGDSVRSVQ